MTKPRDPNFVDEHVGRLIKLRRSQLSMSQEALGDMIGVSFQQIQKYEKGTNRIGCSRLWAISTSLGVQPQFFFDGLNQDTNEDNHGSEEVQAVQELMGTTYGAKVALALSRISDVAFRKQFLKLLEVAGDMQG